MGVSTTTLDPGAGVGVHVAVIVVCDPCGATVVTIPDVDGGLVAVGVAPGSGVPIGATCDDEL
jgi:hypothetical protein